MDKVPEMAAILNIGEMAACDPGEPVPAPDAGVLKPKVEEFSAAPNVPGAARVVEVLTAVELTR